MVMEQGTPALMTLKRLREHQKFVATVDPDDGHWENTYTVDMKECVNEINRLRHALICARHYVIMGNVSAVKEIVTSALFEPQESTDGH